MKLIELWLNIYFEGFSPDDYATYIPREVCESNINYLRKVSEELGPTLSEEKKEMLQKKVDSLLQILPNTPSVRKEVKLHNYEIIPCTDSLLTGFPVTWMDYFMEHEDKYVKFKSNLTRFFQADSEFWVFIDKLAVDKGAEPLDAELLKFHLQFPPMGERALAWNYGYTVKFGTFFNIDVFVKVERNSEKLLFGVLFIACYVNFIAAYSNILSYNPNWPPQSKEAYWNQFEEICRTKESEIKILRKFVPNLEAYLIKQGFTPIHVTDGDEIEWLTESEYIQWFQQKINAPSWSDLFNYLYHAINELETGVEGCFRTTSQEVYQIEYELKKFVRTVLQKRESERDELKKLSQTIDEDIQNYINLMELESKPSPPILESTSKIYTLRQICEFFSRALELERKSKRKRKKSGGFFTIRGLHDLLKRYGNNVSKEKLYRSIQTLESQPNIEKFIERRIYSGQGSHSGQVTYEYRLINPEITRHLKEILNEDNFGGD